MTYSKRIALIAKKIYTCETLAVDRFDLRGHLENVKLLLYRTQALLALSAHERQVQARQVLIKISFPYKLF